MVLSTKAISFLQDRYIERLTPLSSLSTTENGKHSLAPDIRYTVDRAMPDSEDLLEEIETHSLAPDSEDLTEERESYRPANSDRDYIIIFPKPQEGQVGTAGFDLRIGKLISWTDTLMEKITKKEMLEMPHKILEENEEFIFQPDEDGGKVYYVTSFEEIGFSNNLEILVDSKSTTGRVGCMSHGLGFNEDYKLVTIIQPYSFPLKVTCGKTRLAQAAVRYKGSRYMTNEEILECKEIKLEGERLENSLTPKGMQMKFETQKVYKAKKWDQPIDMDARDLDWKNYFELIQGHSQIQLENKTLYLLGSKGVIGLGNVCGLLSREQEVLTGTGTWGHFAGIFQPGFVGGITMEVYSHSKRKISSGDKAGVVIFDKIQGRTELGSYQGTYQGQKPPMLPKMFKTSS